MRRRIRIVILFGLVLITMGFAVVIVNQTAQLVALAERIDPIFGSVVFWSLLTVFAISVGVPLFLILTLPRALHPPDASVGPEYERHLTRLRRRLKSNPKVRGAPDSVTEIEAALRILDVEADSTIKKAASQVFVSTAVSQNGSLDGVIVLAAQSKLIFEVARLYYQRPAVSDLIYLYTNVAATTFVAAELDDLDLSEQVQPILTAVLGSSVGVIPGFNAAATVFTNSVMTGTGNAYLTLRVGLITKQYCRALTSPARRTLRRAAAVQALGLLGGIARDGTASVAAAIWSRPKQYFTDVIENVTDTVSGFGSAVKTKTSAAWQSVRRPKLQLPPSADEEL